MIINRANLDTLFTGYNAAFMEGMNARAEMSKWDKVAMRIQSSTQKELLAWIGEFPNMREWFGERVVHGIAQRNLEIVNRDFELTIEVDRNHIMDDTYGVYTPRFTAMGQATMAHVDDLVFETLSKSFEIACFDGQFLVDTDHPVLDENGVEQSVSNDGGGAGTAWFLLETKMMQKPIIFQERMKADRIVRMDREDDPEVFNRKKYLYGVDCRDAAAPGWWQTIYGSKQDLNFANYEAARNAMQAFTGDHGRPLGIMPDLLVVPPSLEGKAKTILNAERNAQGASNVWKDTADLMVTAWLQ